MGRRKQTKTVVADQFDSSDADSVSSTSTAVTDLTLAHETENVNSLEVILDRCLDSLDMKSTRLKALTELVNVFEGNVLLPYVDNKSITLLDQYINSIKKGKGSEACVACRAIGLLSITVGTGSTAQEIMDQSLPPLEKALLSGTDAIKISVLECLAITTFVGANNWDETEKSMKLMWEIIHPKSVSKVSPVNKPSSAVLAAAVSAWSFLLTTIGSWRIDLNNWMEPISFLYTLLENNDRSVRIAAGEAVAIIFELVIANKLSYEAADRESPNDHSEPKWYKHLVSLKAKIMNIVIDLSMEAAGKGTADKKTLNSQRDFFQKIYTYLKDDECPETSMKVSKEHGMLRTSTWTQLIRLSFLKRFLGSAFLKHAQENELLHDVFDLTPDVKGNLSAKDKRITRSTEEKGRTLERNKHRQLAQQRKGGHILSYNE